MIKPDASVVLLFPAVLIALDLAAAAVYAWHGDWRRCVYWIAAGTLTAMISI